jgi:hypothetical protein
MRTGPKDRAAKQRQLEGSRKGAAAVRAKFDGAMTRRGFCAAVGIHPTTLRKWERVGIVRPKLTTILGSPTRVFSDEEVDFGRRLIRLLRERRGELSLLEAAQISSGAADRDG